LLAPFAFQTPGYVISQYGECLNMLRVAAELGNTDWWAQLFGMLRSFGIQTPGDWQTIARVVAAGCTLLIVVVGFRRFERNRAWVWLYAMTAVYLMLFNPRTENNTYCVLGPAIGFFLAEEVVLRKQQAWGGLLLLLAILATGSYEIGKFMSPTDGRPVWLAPFSCCIFALYLAHRYRQDLLNTDQIVEKPQAAEVLSKAA
jgi:hypothetical protein